MPQTLLKNRYDFIRVHDTLLCAQNTSGFMIFLRLILRSDFVFFGGGLVSIIIHLYMYYVSLEINLSFIYFLVYSQLQDHLNLSLVLLSGNTVVCLLYSEKLPSPLMKKLLYHSHACDICL